MRGITGAAALAYVALAAIENMELLGMPRLGGSAAAIEAAYADTALAALPAGALLAAARTDGRPGDLLALGVLAVAGAAVLTVTEAPGGAARRARAIRSPAPRRLPAPPTPGPTAQTPH